MLKNAHSGPWLSFGLKVPWLLFSLVTLMFFHKISQIKMQINSKLFYTHDISIQVAYSMIWF